MTQDAHDSRPLINYSAKITLWMGIASITILTPFSANSFINNKLLLGFGSFTVIAIMGVITWRGYHGHYYRPMLLVLIPVMIAELMVIYRDLGIMGAFWSYPILLSFFFVLPNIRQAVYASLGLLVTTIPYAWTILDHAIVVRVVATLIAVAALAAIFVHVFKLQQRELEQKERQRRDSMASASHELRTPLSTLVAEVEAMRDGIRPTDQAQLTILARSLEHLSGLLDDLYQLSLADTGGLTVARYPLSLDNLANESLDLIEEPLAKRGIRLIRDIGPNVFVEGDAKRIRQVLDNLLQNSQRYTEPGGTLHVRLTTRGRHASLILADSGPGVGQDTLDNLFTRFFRADASRSRDTGGAGLGMALVKALTEAHGGQVRAFHADEGGLGIEIQLPLADDQAPRSPR